MCSCKYFWKTGTKTSATADCQRETARDGCLSQPFGFRLSDSDNYCHQAEALIWAASRLICTEGFSLRTTESPPFSAKTGLKWAVGQTEHAGVHSRIHGAWEQIMDDSDERERQKEKKQGSHWLPPCLWGKCPRLSVTQALPTKSAVSWESLCSAGIYFI